MSRTRIPAELRQLVASRAEGLCDYCLIHEAETFTLDPEEEAALLGAIAESDRGDVISAEEFLCQLGRDD